MKYVYKSTLLWVFSVLFTLTIAYYQRATGPTHPVKGSITLNEKQIDYKLIRTDTTSEISEFSEIPFTTSLANYIIHRIGVMSSWVTLDC